MVAGGWKREKQSFNRASRRDQRRAARARRRRPCSCRRFFTHSFESAPIRNLAEHEHAVSIGTSVILLVVYALGLLFTLRTHAHIYSPPAAADDEDPADRPRRRHAWSVQKSVGHAARGVGRDWRSSRELLVGSAEPMAEHIGLEPRSSSA